MKNLTREEVLSIPTLKEQGETTKTIAKALEVSEPTIRMWIKRLRAKGYTIKKDKAGRKPLIL